MKLIDSCFLGPMENGPSQAEGHDRRVSDVQTSTEDLESETAEKGPASTLVKDEATATEPSELEHESEGATAVTEENQDESSDDEPEPEPMNAAWTHYMKYEHPRIVRFAKKSK